LRAPCRWAALEPPDQYNDDGDEQAQIGPAPGNPVSGNPVSVHLFEKVIRCREGNPVSVHLFEGNPVSKVIRCRFIFSGKNDELTPDFPDTGFPPAEGMLVRRPPALCQLPASTARRT